VNENAPEITYKHDAAIAQRIEFCHPKYRGSLIKIMKGDGTSAFQHLMLASKHVLWVAATVPDLQVLIVDMSAPFG
ncbi:hypothetical protein JG687_00018516, partial [Phytophthora cactorum]